MSGQALLQHLRHRKKAMLTALETLVRHESPSRDKPALDALARGLEGRLGRLGLDVELIANQTGGDHVRGRFGVGASEAPALVMCHFDTVWPAGTLVKMPFRVEGDRASGPGVYDMKASLVLVEFALEAIRELGLQLPRPVTVLFTSDEEIGSPTSRALIEEQARESTYVLVMEPPLADGRLKTARKGVGQFDIAIEGRAAHAGVEPEKGISAVQELAHQILAIHALARPEAGTTINVGVVQGGTVSNVVPAHATARVDVRVTSMDEARRIEGAMRSLQPVVAGARLTVTGRVGRPPMERTEAVAALFDRAREIGRSIGLDLGEGSTGGASDGNFTAALGVPTLDGLGTMGGGAHAEDEHILVDSLPERAALLVALLTGL